MPSSKFLLEGPLGFELGCLGSTAPDIDMGPGRVLYPPPHHHHHYHPMCTYTRSTAALLCTLLVGRPPSSSSSSCCYSLRGRKTPTAAALAKRECEREPTSNARGLSVRCETTSMCRAAAAAPAIHRSIGPPFSSLALSLSCPSHPGPTLFASDIRCLLCSAKHPGCALSVII